MALSKVKRMQWKEEDMTTVMQAVAQGTPVSTAASAFNVLKKTLDDRAKGRDCGGRRCIRVLPRKHG